ncbi:hypothetical protein Fmac_014123 [Flemingia macrophylla]|uniref:Uncharacterized protein n=1 Tax=Flemingia macrophylla TaxID=520843 RepID=A0ABD1MAX2_9FABA
MSGILAYQTLLWILVAEFLGRFIINVLLTLVASFCFKYNYLSHVIRGTAQVTGRTRFGCGGACRGRAKRRSTRRCSLRSLMRCCSSEKRHEGAALRRSGTKLGKFSTSTFKSRSLPLGREEGKGRIRMRRKEEEKQWERIRGNTSPMKARRALKEILEESKKHYYHPNSSILVRESGKPHSRSGFACQVEKLSSNPILEKMEKTWSVIIYSTICPLYINTAITLSVPRQHKSCL